MPAYSFNSRFVPMVVDGTKRQTIRARRKNPAKVGDTLYLYSGLRTKYCKKLREERCKATTTIVITKFNMLLFAKRLTDEECEIFKSFDLKNKIEYKSIFCKLSTNANILLALDSYPRNQIAYADGFRVEGSTYVNPVGCYELMKRYFTQTHELPFIGDIIYW